MLHAWVWLTKTDSVNDNDLPCLPWVHALQWVPVENNNSVINAV